MKTERKIIIATGLIALIVIGMVYSGIGTRTIAPTSDDMNSKIVCSNGNIYDVSYANIQTAVDSITSTGWIELGAGTYTVTGTTTITNKAIEIRGGGASSFDLSSWNGVCFYFVATTTKSNLNCGLKNIIVTGDDTDTSSVLVNFSNVVGLLEGVESSSARGDRIYKLCTIVTGCNGTRVINNKVECLFGVDVLGIGYQPRGVVIANNHFNGSYLSGTDSMNRCIWMKYGRDSMITGNTINGYCYGVNTTSSYGLVIDGNHINGGLKGIYMYSGQFPTISDNFFMCDYLDCEGVEIDGITYGGTIMGNTIWSYQNNGFIGIYFSDASNGFAIMGNNIIQEKTPTGTYGIYSASTCTNFSITSNCFNNLDALTGTAIYFSDLNGSEIIANTVTNWSTEYDVTGSGTETDHTG